VKLNPVDFNFTDVKSQLKTLGKVFSEVTAPFNPKKEKK